jgi:hypothetical protein
LMMIENSLTNWYSSIQKCVATAEYYGISDCAKHCLWYLYFLIDLNVKINYVTIKVDNKATIYIYQNQSINSRSKHIDINFYHIRNFIKEGKIKSTYIRSQNNYIVL